MADYLAADPEVLLAGGVDLAGVSRILQVLEDEIDDTTYAKYYTGNGEDHITHALDKSYLPAAQACRDVVVMLADLVVHHGQSVVDSGKVLSDADDTATDVAGGRKA